MVPLGYNTFGRICDRIREGFNDPLAHPTTIDHHRNHTRIDRHHHHEPSMMRDATPLADGADAVPTTRPIAGTRVYVGNLSWSVKWQELKDLMQTVGQVAYADVMLDRTGRSKGCGLVEFTTVEDAQRAIATLNDHELSGRKIFLREDREPESGSIMKIAQRNAPPPRSDRHAAPIASTEPPAKTASLFVRNLPFSVTHEQLRDHFMVVGEVDRAQVSMTPDGRSKGFGTVSFFNAEDAAKAIERLNGTDLSGREIAVLFDRPLSQRERRH